MNWRALAFLVNDVFNTQVGWILAGSGILVSLFFFVRIIRQKVEYGSPRWGMIMLGVFLASCIVTWHSHVHMVIAVFPFLMYGYINNLLPKGRVFSWLVFPQAVWLASLFLVAFEIAGILPNLVIHARLRGLSVLAVNLWLLIYLTKKLKDPQYGQEITPENVISK